MEKGIFTWFGYNDSPENIIKAIKSAGFQTIMIDWSDDFATGFKQQYVNLAAKEALKIENGHLSFARINDIWLDNIDGEERTEYLKKYIVSASEFNIPRLIIHVSSSNTPPPISQLGLDRFKDIVETAEKSNICLAFENLRKLEYLEAVLDNCQSKNVGICYDVGHNNCHTHDDTFLERYKDKIIAIHMHDNNGFGDDHFLPFEGSVNWQNEMSKLAKTSYDGSFTLEVVRDNSGFKDLPMDEFLFKASDCADKLIEMLLKAKTQIK